MAHSDLVQSVLRAADILTEIGSARQAPTLRDLGARLGLKIPTLHNLLRTLKARGFVRQQSGRAGYALGPAVFELASQRYESRLMAAAEEAVKTLFVECHRLATVTFSELVGGALQTSLRMSPDWPGLVQKPRQPMLNPYTSATALVMHAFGSDEDKQALYERHPFQEEAGLFAVDPDEYRALLIKTRRQGYALRPVSFSGQLALAAPVLDKNSTLLGVIGLSRGGLTGRANQEAAKRNMLGLLLKNVRCMADTLRNIDNEKK